MKNPRLSFNVIGEDLLTNLSKNIELEIAEKLENRIILNNSSQILDFSFIENPSVFIFEGTGFELSFDNSVGDSFSFPVNGLYMMVVEEDTLDITTITISTTLEVDSKSGD